MLGTLDLSPLPLHISGPTLLREYCRSALPHSQHKVRGTVACLHPLCLSYLLLKEAMWVSVSCEVEQGRDALGVRLCRGAPHDEYWSTVGSWCSLVPEPLSSCELQSLSAMCSLDVSP